VDQKLSVPIGFGTPTPIHSADLSPRLCSHAAVKQNLVQLDIEFHQIIAKASGNRALQLMCLSIHPRALAKLPRTGVVREWLDGLHVQEIFALSKSDGWSIQHHIYADALIAGVRRVQKLPPAELRFPARRISDEDVGRAGGGGGPRRR
jgi:hypothetical protein